MSRLQDLINELCPNGVPYMPIGDTNVSSKVVSGATPSTRNKRYWKPPEIPWMSSGEVNLGTVYKTENFISQEGFNSCSTKMLPPGTVVIALAGQGKTRGKVARTRIELCTNQSLAGIVVQDAMNSDFLFHYLTSQYEKLRSISSGDGTRGGLNLQMIRGFKVPVPPLEVQREIVRILDNFTELEARQVQYAFFRDKIFRILQAEDQLCCLGEVGRFARGAGLQKKDFVDEGVPCIHYGEVYTHYGIWASKTRSFVSMDFARGKRRMQSGDLFIATTSENDEDLGKAVAWLGESDVIASGDGYVYSHDLDPKYASYFFSSALFHEQKARYITGTKVRRISSGAMERMQIPVPPREIQERVAETLDRFDALVNDISSGLPAEIEARRKQYEYYRDKLLDFKELGQ
ncbi:restriction endonuclease subunit S [Actinobaculum massiliense]|uniref:restriction endonuclease subunit S n=1 Tax=Actinobaculum massiliense TaxID=202789 RepID=UPI00288C2EFA|nr:restriction endonuclease subunit S [Actinobaculum massiliense]